MIHVPQFMCYAVIKQWCTTKYWNWLKKKKNQIFKMMGHLCQLTKAKASLLAEAFWSTAWCNSLVADLINGLAYIIGREDSMLCSQIWLLLLVFKLYTGILWQIHVFCTQNLLSWWQSWGIQKQMIIYFYLNVKWLLGIPQSQGGKFIFLLVILQSKAINFWFCRSWFLKAGLECLIRVC